MSVKCLVQEHNTMSLARGLFLDGPKKFAHLESHRKIGNLMITESYYSRIIII